MAFLLLGSPIMKAREHEQPPSQNETNARPAWVREPDEAEKKKQQSQAQTARDEGQSLDEPGYGYGV